MKTMTPDAVMCFLYSLAEAATEDGMDCISDSNQAGLSYCDDYHAGVLSLAGVLIQPDYYAHVARRSRGWRDGVLDGLYGIRQ